jgi:sec-independent protein translocase protein TatA
MPNIRGPELLILVLIIVILFGAKRLPDVARSMGRSMRIFKTETKGLVESETVQDDKPAELTAEQQESDSVQSDKAADDVTQPERAQHHQAPPPGRA